MPWLWEVWSDDEPYIWTRISAPEIQARLARAEAHRERVQQYREVIRQDYPEIYEDIRAAESEELIEPKPDAPKTVRLPSHKTNWYQLYRDITRNWKSLRGLRNRRRIWIDVEEIVTRIKKLREEGKLERLNVIAA